MLEVYIDGACEPRNPGGTASYGVLVQRRIPGVYQLVTASKEPSVDTVIPDKMEVVWQAKKVVGSGPTMSNNVAEYAALVAFLEWFDNYPVEDVIIYSDSQLVVNQMTGKWRVKGGLYLTYFQRAWTIMTHNAKVWENRIKFEWIPREDNLADKLSVEALADVGMFRRK